MERVSSICASIAICHKEDVSGAEPDEDTFILKGWDHNPETKGKVWHFIWNEERYDDKILHCIVSVKQARYLAISKEHNFYDPENVPTVQQNARVNKLADSMHA